MTRSHWYADLGGSANERWFPHFTDGTSVYRLAIGFPTPVECWELIATIPAGTSITTPTTPPPSHTDA